jgi:peptidoglycan/LPS O-acetylase OafA/YrhL
MMTEQIKPLTSLRGIAALMIVTHHFFRFLLPSLGNTTDLYTKFITNAYLWVDFFFILSGFILTHVYAKTLVYNLNRIKMRQFLFSRFSRIYPLHLFMLLPFIGIELLKLTYNQYQHFKGNLSPDLPQAFSGLYSIPDLIASVFLLQNFTFYPAFGDLSFGDTRWNQPAWSISADWLTYLIFPFLLVLLFKIGIKARIFALLASLVGLLFAADPFPHGSLDAAGIIGLVRCIL